VGFRSAVSAAVLRFHRIFSQHFTVMVIPHSERKIFNFQISNYVLLFIFLITGFSWASIYHYQQRRTRLLKELSAVKEINTTYWDTVTAYQNEIDNALSKYEDYADGLKSILTEFGLEEVLSLEPDSRDERRLERKLNREYDRTRIPLPGTLHDLALLNQKLSSSIEHLSRIRTVIATRSDLLSDIPIRWPVYGDKGYKTSGFGVRFSPFEGKMKFHTGLDIAAYPRTPILAAADGTVSFSGVKAGYGYTVIIDHKYGYRTLYAHNARVLVVNGQSVKQGQKIALLGKSGRATGFHVHFEVRLNNTPVDPAPYLDGEL
jgi:murein DD-endopeptidase MepM/ murein hydrolase activator NlpD